MERLRELPEYGLGPRAGALAPAIARTNRYTSFRSFRVSASSAGCDGLSSVENSYMQVTHWFEPGDNFLNRN